MGSKLIPYRMLQPPEATIKEEDKLLLLTHMAEALDKFHKSPIYAKPKPLKSCLKTTNIDPECGGCS